MDYETLVQRLEELERDFKEHRHTGRDSQKIRALNKQAALTAKDATAIDATYDSDEQGVIENNRTRIAEIESALKTAGLLS